MPSPKVRVDHESLRRIAGSFNRHADATQRLVDSLRSQLEVLKNGDWVGKGATQFYGEMDAHVMPAVQRLASALERSAAVTSQISGVMQQAEDDTARLFTSGAGDAGAAEGMASAVLAGGQAFRAASDGSGAGSSSAAQVASPSPGSIGIGSIPGYSAYPSKADGAGGGVVGRMLKNLPPDVRELAAKSPTLLKKLEIAERLGYRIVLGPEGGGSETDHAAKTITIERGHSISEQVSIVAHEAAHAAKGPHVYFRPDETEISKEGKRNFVEVHTEISLNGEGEAVMNQAIAREEILKAGGPDVGIWGDDDGRYLQLYDDYKKGLDTWHGTVHKMGQLYAHEHPSTAPEGTTYREYYTKFWVGVWDDEMSIRLENQE